MTPIPATPQNSAKPPQMGRFARPGQITAWRQLYTLGGLAAPEIAYLYGRDPATVRDQLVGLTAGPRTPTPQPIQRWLADGIRGRLTIPENLWPSWVRFYQEYWRSWSHPVEGGSNGAWIKKWRRVLTPELEAKWLLEMGVIFQLNVSLCLWVKKLG